MQPLISESDRTLLAQHQVRIELDDEQKFGMIVLPNRRLKVSLLKGVQEGADGKAMTLNAEQLKETAAKIAVMLLKKELIAANPPQETRLNFKINQEGITRLTDNFLFKHEDQDEKKNTRADYNALTIYLTQTQAEPQEQVAAQTNDELDQLEDKLNHLDTSSTTVDEVAPNKKEEANSPSQQLITRRPRHLTNPQDLVRMNPRHIFSQLPRWSLWDTIKTIGSYALGLNKSPFSSKPKSVAKDKPAAQQEVKIKEVEQNSSDTEDLSKVQEVDQKQSDIENLPLDPNEPEQTMAYYLKGLQSRQKASQEKRHSSTIFTRYPYDNPRSSQLGLKLLTAPTEQVNRPIPKAESASQSKQPSEGTGEIQVEEMSPTINMDDQDLILHQHFAKFQQKKQKAKQVKSQASPRWWNNLFGQKQSVPPQSNSVQDASEQPETPSSSKEESTPPPTKIKQKPSRFGFPKYAAFPDDDSHLLHSFMKRPYQQKKPVQPFPVPKITTSAPKLTNPTPKPPSVEKASFFSAHNPYAFNAMNQF
jgi:hypothetical protein